MIWNDGGWMDQETASRILRTVPREKAFYFFTSIGNYTGASASSLKEFMAMIKDVNIKSLEFHLYRGDFEKWMTDVLQDNVLAGEIKRLQTYNQKGAILRNQLSIIIAERIKKLTGQLYQTRVKLLDS
jgi:hypothetical protein